MLVSSEGYYLGIIKHPRLVQKWVNYGSLLVEDSWLCWHEGYLNRSELPLIRNYQLSELSLIGMLVNSNVGNFEPGYGLRYGITTHRNYQLLELGYSVRVWVWIPNWYGLNYGLSESLRVWVPTVSELPSMGQGMG